MTLPLLTVDRDIVLRPGERVSIAQNRINGQYYYVTNLDQREINGQPYVAVFRRVQDRHCPSWIQKESLTTVGPAVAKKPHRQS
jgi:hypothetical protein